MSSNLRPPFFARFIPFLSMGLAIVVFVIGIVIFSYVLIFAAIVGLVLFVIAYIRTQFFKQKTHRLYRKNQSGRTIDYDETDHDVK